MTVEFGLALVYGPPAGQLDRFLGDLDIALPQLERSFRSLWMTDHFFWHEDPTYEAWTVLAYLAARYPTWEIGPMVLGQNYRNPALLAKMTSTLQALSGGRFLLGIGAGWKEDEYRAYGYEYPRPGTRIEQLEDTLEIITRLWKQPGKVTYHGKHYEIVDAINEPKPDPVPPLIVGGGGNKTMMLAARFADIWNISDANYEKYAGMVSTLRNHCDAIGRDPASLRLSWFGRVGTARTEAEAEARGGKQWTRDNAFIGTPDQVVAEMSRFVELGCDYFMLDLLGLPETDVIGIVMEEIVPRLQALK